MPHNIRFTHLWRFSVGGEETALNQPPLQFYIQSRALISWAWHDRHTNGTLNLNVHGTPEPAKTYTTLMHVVPKCNS